MFFSRLQGEGAVFTGLLEPYTRQRTCYFLLSASSRIAGNVVAWDGTYLLAPS